MPSTAPPSAGPPLLVALHGNRSTPERELAQWSSAVDRGWALVLPGSRQPAWTPGFVWDDGDQAREDVAAAVELVRQNEPINAGRIVIGGFSAGGLRAIEIALGGRLAVCGLMTVAAFLTDQLIAAFPPIPESAAFRAHLVIGELDTSLAAHRILRDRLRDAGVPTVLDVRAKLGHVYPSDMPASVEAVLVAARALPQ